MTQSSTTPFGKGVKQRAVIRMTPEEIQAFLREQRTMSCATINHDGTIHVIAMWYGFLDGCPALETKTKSQKVQNLRRDPRISCLVEDGDVYEQLRGVEIVGHAEIIDDPEQMCELGKSVVERHMSNGQPSTPDFRPPVEAMLTTRGAVGKGVAPLDRPGTDRRGVEHHQIGVPAGRDPAALANAVETRRLVGEVVHRLLERHEVPVDGVADHPRRVRERRQHVEVRA